MNSLPKHLLLIPLFAFALRAASPEKTAGPGAIDSRPDTLYYHSYARMMNELDSLARNYPAIALLETLGTTQSGQRAIAALRITGSSQPEEHPAILFDGVHHGDEFIGTEVCMALACSLLAASSEPETRRLIDSLRIWIVPMVNPDGHEIDFSGADTWWRKNTRDNNGNGYFDFGDGVDLNRNYSFLWDSGGSGVPADREYRGPFPFSEAETRSMAALADQERPVIEAAYHSDQDSIQGEQLYYPWSWDGHHSPDYDFIKPVAEALAGSIIRDDGSGTYVAEIGYAATGAEFRNWSYYSLGTFAFTVEVSRGYYPPGPRVESICRRNLVGAYYLMDRALGTSIRGVVTDSLTGEPLSAGVTLLEKDTVPNGRVAPRTADLSGRFERIVNPGTYHLEVSCPGYIARTIGPVEVYDGVPTSLAVRLARLRPGWQEVSSVPSLPSARPVTSGGWLAYNQADRLVYALKGGRRGDFYSFDPARGVWHALETIPRGVEKKSPGKGAKGVWDQGAALYATKGNNSLGFWQYHSDANVWQQMPNIPAPDLRRRIRGGTDLAYVVKNGVGYVYLLKGYLNEFYRYNTLAGIWETMPDAPNPESKRWADGSWLVTDGGRYLYAHKAREQEFYVYDVIADAWLTNQLNAMPWVGRSGRRKKSRDGGSADWHNGHIYALKGGNTQEFWRYDVARNSWEELDTVPSVGSSTMRRRINGGAGITSIGEGILLALKGNRTREFYEYVPLSGFGRPLDAAADRLDNPSARVSLRVAPNPVRGISTIDYSLAAPGRVTLKLYDVDGRLVCIVVDRYLPAGHYSLRLALPDAAPGVYLLRLAAGATGSVFRADAKLILER